jgi:phage major head subunit gpT-like protein
MPGIAQYGPALDALYQNFNAAFQEGLVDLLDEYGRPWWSQVATEMPSDTDEEVHAWIQQIPTVREWLGDRVLNALSESSYRLKNRTFENTVQVSKDRVADRKIGVEAPLMRMLGYQFAKFPDRTIATELLIGYAARKCYDGKAFFADDHPVNVLDAGKGTFDNLRASTALTAANFDTIFAAMAGFKNADGEVLGIVPDTLIVPPQLRTTAHLIAHAAFVPSSAGTATQSNPNEGVVGVLVLPELASESTTWYLGKLKGPLKPLLRQVREAPVFDLVFGPDSDHCKKTRQLAWGADCREAFGYTLPQLMVRCTA